MRHFDGIRWVQNAMVAKQTGLKSAAMKATPDLVRGLFALLDR